MVWECNACNGPHPCRAEQIDHCSNLKALWFNINDHVEMPPALPKKQEPLWEERYSLDELLKIYQGDCEGECELCPLVGKIATVGEAFKETNEKNTLCSLLDRINWNRPEKI